MYYLIVDRGLPTETQIWEGNSLATGLQNLNREVAANEPGDFEVIELLRKTDAGGWTAERTFRYRS